LRDGVESRRTRKRVPQRGPQSLDAGTLVNQGRALDFIHDGREFRTLNVIDEANREAPAIKTGTSIPARRLIRTMDRLIDWYGVPNSIRMDNGPEMTSQDFTEWSTGKCIKLRYIQPAEPNQNAYIERFNRIYRHKVLDAYLFKTIEQVQRISEEWLIEYNEQRPHDTLGGAPPRQFLSRLTMAVDSRNQLST
jgi:putative transposase